MDVRNEGVSYFVNQHGAFKKIVDRGATERTPSFLGTLPGEGLSEFRRLLWAQFWAH